MKRYISIAFVSFLIMFGTNLPAYARYNDLHAGINMVPEDDAKEIINDIINVIGLKPNFEVHASNIPNAAAVASNGKRYVIYNPHFITKLNTAAGNKWASVSVLAHEIGHHLNGHTLTNVGSKPGLELEADEFSGFILRKMGATLEQSQIAMKLAASYKPSLTHPGQGERLIAIEKGWKNAAAPAGEMAKYSKPVPSTNNENTVYEPNNIANNNVPRQQPGVTERNNRNSLEPSRRQAVLNSKYILGNVSFPSDQSGDYYVTIRYNLVKIVNNQVYIVGKMQATNNADYPYILRSDFNHTLFVDRYGKILTAKKRVAGYLKIV